MKTTLNRQGQAKTEIPASLKVVPRYLIIFSLIWFYGCGDEGLIDPHGQNTLPTPKTTGTLRAIDFPTDTGSAWTYINIDTDQEFTLRIEGTRDISGTTHRQMTISEMTPSTPDQFNWETVDHLTANAFYFRAGTEFLDIFPFPISATYFSKTPRALVESAFDVFLPAPQSGVTTYHGKHFPPRQLWNFPLELGKQWIVFEKKTGIPATATRYVVETDVEITVPAGSYITYVVHEEVSYADSEASSIFLISPPAIYWIAPSVGIVRYRYSRYRITDTPTAQTFELKKLHLPGPNTN